MQSVHTPGYNHAYAGPMRTITLNVHLYKPVSHEMSPRFTVQIAFFAFAPYPALFALHVMPSCEPPKMALVNSASQSSVDEAIKSPSL